MSVIHGGNHLVIGGVNGDGHVEIVNACLVQVGHNRLGVLNGEAAGHALVCGEAIAQNEVAAALFSHICDDLHQEFHPVEEIAAVFIRALIGVQGQKLRDHVAVGPVQLDSVKARFLRPSGRIAEVSHRLVDLLNGHLMRHFPVVVGIGNRRGRPGLCLCELLRGLSARMIQLCNHHGTVLMNPVRHRLEAGDVLLFPEARNPLIALCHRCNRDVFRDDHAKAALCLCLVVSGKALGTCAVFLTEICQKRIHYAAILQRLPIDCNF